MKNFGFFAKQVATIMGYKDTRKAIEVHVDNKYKCKMEQFKGRGESSPPLKMINLIQF